MQQIGIQEVIVLFVTAILLCGMNLRELALRTAEAISDFRSNFPRGPGSPSHPIPAGDSKIINRKRSHSDNESI
jgi:hypothetical protein